MCMYAPEPPLLPVSIIDVFCSDSRIRNIFDILSRVPLPCIPSPVVHFAALLRKTTTQTHLCRCRVATLMRFTKGISGVTTASTNTCTLHPSSALLQVSSVLSFPTRLFPQDAVVFVRRPFQRAVEGTSSKSLPMIDYLLILFTENAPVEPTVR